MKINYIDKKANSVNLKIEPIITHNALIEPLYSNNQKFTDEVDLIVIENYNETLHNNINLNSLRNIDISNVDSGDLVTIEGVQCEVVVIFDGFIRMSAPELGKPPRFNMNYEGKDFPF